VVDFIDEEGERARNFWRKFLKKTLSLIENMGEEKETVILVTNIKTQVLGDGLVGYKRAFPRYYETELLGFFFLTFPLNTIKIPETNSNRFNDSTKISLYLKEWRSPLFIFFKNIWYV